MMLTTSDGLRSFASGLATRSEHGQIWAHTELFGEARA